MYRYHYCQLTGPHIQTIVHALTRKIYSKLSNARMKVWGTNTRWIKTCVVSNKRGADSLHVVGCLDLPEELLNSQYCFKLEGCGCT